MTARYSEDEVIAAISRLTRAQLRTFIEAEIVTPVQTDSGPAYRQVDLVRMELLCELSEAFDLHADALGVVMSLIDQLHSARADLRAVLDAVASQPPEVRDQIGDAIRRAARS